ncbi:acyltransferase family protein [Planctobacterium marinum]|uniref:Acyltransferase 3 domain-containing protein n=1 Tax=Planctobacterium marinum TaxID=1631968 RepID=A0AA48I562_9ALTE|nr:hypothetical protein MACH26_16410 [Planctobacterium marinum]
MNNAYYIPHIHAFRGLAIIAIVAAHAWSFPIFWTGTLDSAELTALFHIMETLFHGSTLYFAIISGVLFSKVLVTKTWPAFFKGKLLNVLMPYIVLTLLITLLNWQFFPVNKPEDWPLLAQFNLNFLSNLYYGQAMIHFWYIPVLLVLFVATPLLWRIQRKYLWVSVIIALMPLVVSRSPFPDFLKIQSLVYFLGAYQLGMLMGEYYAAVQRWVARYLAPITIITLFCSLLIYLLFHWQYQAQGFYSLIQTAIYLQKTGFCLLLMHYLANKEPILPSWLMTLGTYSFSIYFLHVLVMWPYILSLSAVLTEYRRAWVIFSIGLLNLLLAVLVSVAVASLVKRFTGKYSRILIGS